MKQFNLYTLLIPCILLFAGSNVLAQKDTIEFESGKKKIIIVEKDKKEMHREMMEKNKEMFEHQIEMAEELIKRHEEMLQDLEEHLEDVFHGTEPDTNFQHFDFEFEFENDTTFKEYTYKYKFKNVNPENIDSIKKIIKIEFEDNPDDDIEVIILGKNDLEDEKIIRHKMEKLHDMHELDRLNRELQRHKMMIELNEQKKKAFEESLNNMENIFDKNDDDMAWIDHDCNDNENHSGKKVVYRKRFNAHLAGFEFGLLNFLNDRYTLVNNADMTFLEIIPEKTFNYHLNILEFNIPLHKYYFGFATGAGIEWNSLALAENVTLFEDENHTLQAEYIPLDEKEFTRNKLNSAYITIPVLLELQIPIKYHKFYVQAGFTGSMRAWSKQKQIYFVDDQKLKNNNIDDFQLSPFKYGIITGIGYGKIGLFAEYSLAPMFVKGAGPEIFPVSVGLHVIDF